MKTYSHLLPLRRMPTDYEIATTGLLYYPGRGFEVALPLTRWYDAHQRDSPLQCTDWERFVDPRQTTYTRYVTLQRTQEAFLDGLLQSIDDSGYDRALPAARIDLMERVLAPIRYPLHGLQMAAAYIGSMAPSGRITVAAAMQAADETRRIQRIACRMAQLRRIRPTFGDASRQAWERDPAWQPLREVIERLLVTWDWGHALVALNGAVKPALDDFLFGIAEGARAAGDYQLGEFLFAFREDIAWQRAWTDALLQMVSEDRPSNMEAVRVWSAEWQGAAAHAVARLEALA
jgi:hypothetical protein